MKTVLLTGSQGFIGTYLVKELLSNGYRVVGIDNYSKYGYVKRAHDNHENFRLIVSDLQYSPNIIYETIDAYRPNYIIASAAMIGGIGYFHKHAYTLLAHNERVIANTYDGALHAHTLFKCLEKVVVVSSSMVYGNAVRFPSREESTETIPPPSSAYGFQKLACEYFAKAAYDQYKIPYSIVRPFNCIGVGEEKAVGDEMTSGDIKMTMEHVLPDLIKKCLMGQNPLHVFGDGQQIRCFTHGSDIARGIRLAMEYKDNLIVNIGTDHRTTIEELARMVWNRINQDKTFNIVADAPYEHDIQVRIPDITTAFKYLHWVPSVTLDNAVDEVIDFIKNRDFLTRS